MTLICHSCVHGETALISAMPIWASPIISVAVDVASCDVNKHNSPLRQNIIQVSFVQVGSLDAVYFANQGYEVHVYESRPGMYFVFNLRMFGSAQGRNMNHDHET